MRYNVDAYSFASGQLALTADYEQLLTDKQYFKMHAE